MRKLLAITLLFTLPIFAQVDTVKINEQLQKKQQEFNQVVEQLKEAEINIARAKANVYDLLVKQQGIIQEANALAEEKKKVKK